MGWLPSYNTAEGQSGRATSTSFTQTTRQAFGHNTNKHTTINKCTHSNNDLEYYVIPIKQCNSNIISHFCKTRRKSFKINILQNKTTCKDKEIVTVSIQKCNVFYSFVLTGWKWRLPIKLQNWNATNSKRNLKSESLGQDTVRDLKVHLQLWKRATYPFLSTICLYDVIHISIIPPKMWPRARQHNMQYSAGRLSNEITNGLGSPWSERERKRKWDGESVGAGLKNSPWQNSTSTLWLAAWLDMMKQNVFESSTKLSTDKDVWLNR